MYEGTVIFHVNEKHVHTKNEICHNTLYITSYSHTYIHPLKGESWLCNQSLHFTLFVKPSVQPLEKYAITYCHLHFTVLEKQVDYYTELLYIYFACQM